jgi:hypothetical protein
VTGSYTQLSGNPWTVESLTEELKYALSNTIGRNAALCCGLVARTEAKEAHLVQLPAIQWDDVTEFLISTSLSGDEDDRLAEKLGVAHQLLFTDQHRRPAWKLVVLVHQDQISQAISRVDVAFVCHHGIGDGTSCAGIHKLLLKHWNQAQNQPKNQTYWPYIVHENLISYPFIEEVLPFLLKPRDSSIPNKVCDESHPFDPWTSNRPLLPSIENYVSCAKIITISEKHVKDILNVCRRLKITLTGFLHGLIVIYFSKTIKEAHGFRGSTPISVRRFTNTSEDEFVNYFSCISNNWKEPLLNDARSSSENTKEESAIISEISRQYQVEITQDLTRFPISGSPLFENICAIKDLDQYCKDAMKKKRSNTYEISNIGLVKRLQMTEKDFVRLEKLVFTQCGNVSGEAIGCGVISLADGPLVVSLHWQEGAMKEEVVQGLSEYITRRLSNICI